jgi:hypothetical protein
MKQKEVLIISLTLFITICGWIVADIYHVKISKFINNQDTQLLLQANKIKIERSVFSELLLRK